MISNLKLNWNGVAWGIGKFLASFIISSTFAILFTSISAFFLWMIFLMFLFHKWDSRYVGAVAILILTSVPILLSLEKEVWAEQMAVYAYFFLVMTVVLQIVEFKRDQRNDVLENKLKVELNKVGLEVSKKKYGSSYVLDLRPKKQISIWDD